MAEVPEPFRCDVSYIDSRAVVLPRGELDLSTAPLLLREVLASLALPVAAVTVDLRHVSFLDSSGIQALLTAQGEAHERHIAFVLSSVQPQALTVLEVTGLAESFGLVRRADALPKPKGSVA
jgi:anti-sigma B factor antagonist